MLEALDLARFFKIVVGGDTLAQRKPHPAQILHALAGLGVAPGAALMVGDNHHDVKAARAAERPPSRSRTATATCPMRSSGADRLVASLTELLPLLEG